MKIQQLEEIKFGIVEIAMSKINSLLKLFDNVSMNKKSYVKKLVIIVCLVVPQPINRYIQIDCFTCIVHSNCCVESVLWKVYGKLYKFLAISSKE